MIDLANVFFNSLWILGLAIILAAFSYHSWFAGQSERSLKQQLGQPLFQVWLSFGLTLVSLALTLFADIWWERIIWLAFTAIFTWQTWRFWKQRDAE